MQMSESEDLDDREGSEKGDDQTMDNDGMDELFGGDRDSASDDHLEKYAQACSAFKLLFPRSLP